ncbi:MAG: hypothetical protein OEZ01_14685, partial [Candidatus Heimdallarchaeota archaeon]|nr:hypothetical protein [Candidatus Heimdallarchaeota archaeon]
MNILFITDSLGYPREGDNIFFTDTYFYKICTSILKDHQIEEDDFTKKWIKYKNFHDIFIAKLIKDQHKIKIISISSMDVRILQKIINLMDIDNISHLFIQVGIVDCTPRILSRREVQIISKIKPLSLIVKPFLKRKRKEIINNYYLRHTKFKRYIDEESFNITLSNIIKTVKDKAT